MLSFTNRSTMYINFQASPIMDEAFIYTRSGYRVEMTVEDVCQYTATR